ncbi:MAG: CBS domain-containing protein [Candidatus Baldrarchaeia archaeon]
MSEFKIPELPTAEDIKRLRRMVKLTQAELAKLAGVSQSLIARIEKGSVDPRLSTLRKIIEAIKKAEKKNLEKKKASDVMYKGVITVRKNDTVKKAVELMEKYAISQLPVVDENGYPVGGIQESTILKKLLDYDPNELFEMKVEEIMEECFPLVSPSTSIDTVYELILSGHPAVLVMDKGKLVGIITKIDLISHAKK